MSTLGTVASEMGVVRVLAGPTVGAKEVSVGVLHVQFFRESPSCASARLGVFAILASPALPQMTRIAAITGEGLVALLIEGFQTAPPVEAMGVSAFDGRHLAIFAEPAVGAATILKILVMGRPQILVSGIVEFPNPQPAVSLTSLKGGTGRIYAVQLGRRPIAGKGALRHGSPQKLAVGTPVSGEAVARPVLLVKVQLAASLGRAVLLRGFRAAHGPLDLAVLSKVRNPVVLGVGAVAKGLCGIDGLVRPVRQSLDALSAVIAEVHLLVLLADIAIAQRKRADLVRAAAPQPRKAHGTVAVPPILVRGLQEGKGCPVWFLRMEPIVVFSELAFGAVGTGQRAFGGRGWRGHGSQRGRSCRGRTTAIAIVVVATAASGTIGTLGCHK